MTMATMAAKVSPSKTGAPATIAVAPTPAKISPTSPRGTRRHIVPSRTPKPSTGTFGVEVRY